MNLVFFGRKARLIFWILILVITVIFSITLVRDAEFFLVWIVQFAVILLVAAVAYKSLTRTNNQSGWEDYFREDVPRENLRVRHKGSVGPRKRARN
jgi:hypothetical protein